MLSCEFGVTAMGIVELKQKLENAYRAIEDANRLGESSEVLVELRSRANDLWSDFEVARCGQAE